MSTPKMLPWLASTVGIDLERAEQLWQKASDHAESVTGETEGGHYLAIAHEEMVMLVEEEILARHSVEDAPWLMIQAHLGVAPMIVADTVAQATAVARQALDRLTEKKPHTVA